MPVGSFRQKANWFTVGFVFGCIAIIIVLLYLSVRAENKAEELSYQTGDYSQYMR
jgi:protein-S-isoprenylcysteine O-methyltransferase Ste14